MKKENKKQYFLFTETNIAGLLLNLMKLLIFQTITYTKNKYFYDTVFSFHSTTIPFTYWFIYNNNLPLHQAFLFHSFRASIISDMKTFKSSWSYYKSRFRSRMCITQNTKITICWRKKGTLCSKHLKSFFKLKTTV